MSLDRVDEAVDLVEATGEDAKRDGGGEKLEKTGEAEEPIVEGRVTESFGHEAG